ncbi:MAG: DUF4886 domain-containing protein [Clostridia bacterium]|nr:DUF4886 domain-containing protein [Clostridia bacterium]
MDRILFIGNSFTYFNNLPSLFSALCESAGIPVQVESVVKGGWYLSRYADPQDEMHPAILAAAQKEWDYVILQDQSFNPAGNQEDFLSGARKLSQLFPCRKKLVFYQTWAYEEGSAKLSSTGMTYEQLHESLRDAYQQAAKEMNALCVPAGDAFRLAHDQYYYKFDLYRADAFHPSILGSYMIACTFFGTLFNKSPLDCITPRGVAAEHAHTLRKLAHDACFPNAPATSILFIGNSHTYFNDLPAMVTEMAHAAGVPVYTRRVVKGGWKLCQHADPQGETHQSLLKARDMKMWDYIVLQEQAMMLTSEEETFLSSVCALRELLKDHCHAFALYQTHAYHGGSDKLRATGLTYNEMHEKLKQAYLKAASLIEAKLIPSGDGFAHMAHQYNRYELVQHDGVHATAAGTYLAACLLCAVLLGLNPLHLKTMESVDENLAAIIRQIAHDTLNTPNETEA